MASNSSNLRFSAEMVDFKHHLDFVKNGLGASKTDLAVMLIRFEVVGNKAILFAANKELFCRTEIRISRPEGDEEKAGSFAVLGSKLSQLCSTVEAESLSLEADGENLQIQVGFLTVNLEVFDGAVLRTIEQGVTDHLTKEGPVVPREALEEALVCAGSCATSSSIRPDITHVELRGGKMLSSDGRKIMIYVHPQFPTDLVFKVPVTALGDIAGAVKHIQAESVEIVDNKGYYYLKADRNRFTAGVRKTERSFPPVEAQTATSLTNVTDEISVDKAVFENMIRGVALGLPSDEVQVIIEVDGPKTRATLEVAAYNAVGRRSYERAACGRKGSDHLSIPLSFKHLLDTLSVFKGDSVVDLFVATERNLLLIRDKTPVREVQTIIPFRTAKAVAEEKKERSATTEARKKAKPEVEEEESREAVGAASD